METPEDARTGSIVPPHDFEIEMGLLALLMANNGAVERVADALLPEHFADARHGRIYEAIVRLTAAGRQANALTLRAYFDRDDDLREIGGTAYLAQLQAAAILTANARDYADRICDLHRRRALIALSNDVASRASAFVLGEDSLDLVEWSEARLFELAERGVGAGIPLRFDAVLGKAIDVAERAFRRGSAVTGVTTGFPGIDRKLGGLQQSDLVVLAGRPGMGKTALATNIAFNAALARLRWRDEATARGEEIADHAGDGATVAIFSLEMSADQLATRLLSEQVAIPSDCIRRGEIAAEEFPRFVQAASNLARLPLYIDDTPGLTVAAIRTRARRMIRRSGVGLGLIVIDYLQLLLSPPGQRPENRVQEISAITRGLKQLAKELQVPVLALSQLSRAVEARDDKRPLLSDLRESGTIEQDADVVLFVFREHYYLSHAKPVRQDKEGQTDFNDRIQEWETRLNEVRDIAELIIAKHRHGDTGVIQLMFEGKFTKFSDQEIQIT